MKSKGVAVILMVVFPIVAMAQEETSATSRLSGMSEYDKYQDFPDSEKIKKAATFLSETKGALGHVLLLLKEAREEKDVIKINCINEKLTNIKGLIRVAEQSDIVLQETAAKGEKEAAAHEFHKIFISHQKVKTLRTEAEQCVGELAFAVGKTKVVVEKDEELVPEDDPTDIDLPDTPVIRPIIASPFQ